MPHINVIIQTISFCYNQFSDDLKIVIEVIADLFDAIDSLIDTILIEMNPLTATISGMLPEYERYYQCTVVIGDTVEIRRNRVVATIRNRGGLDRAAFYRLADAMGYTIGTGIKAISLIEGHYYPFRAGYGRAGIDKIYDQTVGASLYDVIVSGNDVETDTTLQFLFNKQKAAGINFNWENL